MSFLLFFRLPIYNCIAAIFWQSASYVLKVEWESGFWTKIRFLGSVFLFTCGNFTLIFTVFLFYFCLNCFLNSFIVHSRPSLLFELSLHFSFLVFCSHVAFRHWFLVFLKLFSDFFRNGFHNSLIFRSRSSFFCLVIENFLNFISRLVLLCFLQFKEFELYWGAVLFFF